MLSRRRFLTGLAAAGALGVTGCTVPSFPDPPTRERARCVPRAELARHGEIGAARLHYDIDGEPRPVHFDAGFHRQLESWWADWRETSGLGDANRIDNFGAWIDGRGACDSWHHAGRAFDLGRIRRDGDVLVSCREDVWAGTSDEPQRRRGYWALAAHLHIHFAHVLTYLFDAAHRNHIHLDNGLSGSGLSTFRPGSRVQVQVVQASARWLFDEPVEITGRLDAETRRAAESVLDSLGLRGGLTSADNWHAYLRAAAGRGQV
ncbi:twin-arginine translocation signal domain-containing protein [Granulicoccus sp. GXG6511]|uniref:twin-arginine translocation signal domain-containing protein n=1 Tax=Granulicoccus sp. GXG6511 TaxID=3381351 RepID=UPI003D7EA2EA